MPDASMALSPVHVHLPRDVATSPGGPVKRLAAVVRTHLGEWADDVAAAWVVKAFAFLAVNARADSFGRIPSEDRLLFEGEFSQRFGPVIPMMEQSGLLVPDDGGWVCPCFKDNNPHLSGRTVGLNPAMGGKMKHHHRVVGEALKAGPEQLGLLPADHFCSEDGKPFESEQVQGIQALLIALDSVTGRAVARSHSLAADWPVDTVRAAALVLALKPRPYLLAVVADLRRLDLLGHPAVPRTTELILNRFQAVMALVEAARAAR